MTFYDYFEIGRNIISKQGPLGFIEYCSKEGIRIVYRQIIRGSFSQNWEDLFVLSQFPKNYHGYYIDIGAHHPIRLSNTYLLYKNSWTGICVEPNPYVANVFTKFRPKDKYISAGVGITRGQLDFYNFTIPAISTFSINESLSNQKQGYQLKEILKINIISPHELYKHIPKNNQIDFLSIDTEGWDFPILSAWDWYHYSPKVICVEQGHQQSSIYKLLQKHHYKPVCSNKINSIFKLDYSTSPSPNKI